MHLLSFVAIILELCTKVPNNESDPNFYSFYLHISLDTLPEELSHGGTDDHPGQGEIHGDHVSQLQTSGNIDTNTTMKASTTGEDNSCSVTGMKVLSG